MRKKTGLTAAAIDLLIEKMRLKIFPAGRMTTADFKKFLYAVQHIERYRAKDVRSGRPPRFARTLLLKAAGELKALLADERGGRISLLYFIAVCLPVTDYPADIRRALDAGLINLDEAKSLNLINAAHTGENNADRRLKMRRELLTSHLKRKGTQKELRERVRESFLVLPAQKAALISGYVSAIEFETDDLLRFDAHDTAHLLWEEIKGLIFVLREIDVTKIPETAFEELLDEVGSITLKIRKYRVTT